MGLFGSKKSNMREGTPDDFYNLLEPGDLYDSQSNPHEIQEKIQNLIHNESFRRFARCFELYQEILQSVSTDIQSTVKVRMRQLHDKIDKLKSFALQQAESSSFTPLKLAEKIVSLGRDRYYLAFWGAHEEHPKNQDRYVNKVVYYEQEPDGALSFHIDPNTLSATAQLSQLMEGFRIVAQKIAHNDLSANKIILISWLLGEQYQTIIHRVFRKIKSPLYFRAAVSEKQSVQKTQRLALEYNTGLLRKYLISGKLPQVRELHLNTQEFVSAFMN